MIEQGFKPRSPTWKGGTVAIVLWGLLNAWWLMDKIVNIHRRVFGSSLWNPQCAYILQWLSWLWCLSTKPSIPGSNPSGCYGLFMVRVGEQKARPGLRHVAVLISKVQSGNAGIRTQNLLITRQFLLPIEPRKHTMFGRTDVSKEQRSHEFASWTDIYYGSYNISNSAVLKRDESWSTGARLKSESWNLYWVYYGCMTVPSLDGFQLPVLLTDGPFVLCFSQNNRRIKSRNNRPQVEQNRMTFFLFSCEQQKLQLQIHISAHFEVTGGGVEVNVLPY